MKIGRLARTDSGSFGKAALAAAESLRLPASASWLNAAASIFCFSPKTRSRNETSSVGTRLITDLRPVFDDEAEKIVRMSASFVLSIDFYASGHYHSMDLALDLADVSKLGEQCTRAQKKAETIKRELGAQGWVTVVAGDQDE